MTHTISRRPVRTYMLNGREVYADTGRRVDEEFGSHVVLWIVDDAEAWAKAIEAEGDAEPDKWPKNRRHIGEHRRLERYESAAQVRARGPYRSVRCVHFGAARADAVVAELYRSHPNPGVRYEVAEITDVRACPTCHQPAIHADGQWWHHTGGYPIGCTLRLPKLPEKKEKRQAGEWEIGTQGYMICGYCGERESWPQPIVAGWELTGFHLLGIERASGTLVVLAEATTLTGEIVHLPHHCRQIPDDVRTTYAPKGSPAR
jgi:hypothetical protein